MTRRRANNGRRVFTNAKNGSRVFPHSSAEITTLVSATTRMHNVWLAVARGFYGTGKSLLGNLAPEFAQRANFTGRKYFLRIGHFGTLSAIESVTENGVDRP
ncbi:MAG: hypothetical protein A2W52_00260 [Candidatus Taylorbacteria bacterium RIFCSPHIGHO2_02_49_25]|uniref:Uncharacterized protein n=1 Tax=Candidatus Taylorbacteria bacterium RIFCSPHIGHO2_02_49_25 TaxID=1802305 RepID=A0A1G2MGW3_9BACT|nr:MAG: hypothetical protein A2W52_00260 [Candidatus Taylorbacteria bacterium RIFCSPHIGHO2_02_49_25]OHA36165.1 MAG: hypothetical protein A2W65_02370 [Candidatus Taylorbacteria bacterium RIFCSPLOWO2_02_50_13]